MPQLHLIMQEMACKVLKTIFAKRIKFPDPMREDPALKGEIKLKNHWKAHQNTPEIKKKHIQAGSAFFHNNVFSIKSQFVWIGSKNSATLFRFSWISAVSGSCTDGTFNSWSDSSFSLLTSFLRWPMMALNRDNIFGFKNLPDNVTLRSSAIALYNI